MSIILEGTLEMPGDDAVEDFEREGGKIKRRSQRNIVRAIRELGFRFETDDVSFPGEICIRRADDSFFYSNEEATLKKVWLGIERQFGFLPAWTFFRTVFIDYAERNAVPNNTRADWND